MRKYLSLLGILCFVLLVAADDKKPEDVGEKLKGTWNLVSMEKGGEKMPADVIKDKAMVFDGQNVDFTDKKDAKATKKATYKIDVSQKPAHLDVTPLDGPEKGKTASMLFQLDGDTLKIGMRPGDKERPKSFEDAEIIIMTLAREKK